MRPAKKKALKWVKCVDCGLQCSVSFKGTDGKERCVRCAAKKGSEIKTKEVK